MCARGTLLCVDQLCYLWRWHITWNNHETLAYMCNPLVGCSHNHTNSIIYLIAESSWVSPPTYILLTSRTRLGPLFQLLHLLIPFSHTFANQSFIRLGNNTSSSRYLYFSTQHFISLSQCSISPCSHILHFSTQHFIEFS